MSLPLGLIEYQASADTTRRAVEPRAVLFIKTFTRADRGGGFAQKASQH
jgi:hypothetical protein